jgi:hypothetical protein
VTVADGDGPWRRTHDGEALVLLKRHGRTRALRSARLEASTGETALQNGVDSHLWYGSRRKMVKAR